MAWTITRGSTQQIKLCNDELPSGQLVIGMLQSTQGTRKRTHIQEAIIRQNHHEKQEMGYEDDDIGDELAINPAEKKRRLTVDQVKFLEMSFSMDLKLEPERKAMIAKQLGLRPRQVAIWFQNRRARWKNKQLERDFEALQEKYEAAIQENDSMVKQNEALLEENKRLQAEVAHLKVLMHDDGVMEKPASPDADSDVESGSAMQWREQKPENLVVGSSPTKSDESQSEVQDSSTGGYTTGSPWPVIKGSGGSYTSSSSCPMVTEAKKLAMVDAPTCISRTALQLEPAAEERHLALISPAEELPVLVNNPWLFQHNIATAGVQFHHYMEDICSYSSSDHYLYGWGGQWDP